MHLAATVTDAGSLPSTVERRNIKLDLPTLSVRYCTWLESRHFLVDVVTSKRRAEVGWA